MSSARASGRSCWAPRDATIKEIGKAARAEIGEMAGVPVHLFLFVKVREHWADDPERYREMGLDYPKGR